MSAEIKQAEYMLELMSYYYRKELELTHVVTNLRLE